MREISLPYAVRAVTLPNDDCTFDIYVNQNLPRELQEQALEHELTHIGKDHFYNCDPVWVNEKEAGWTIEKEDGNEKYSKNFTSFNDLYYFISIM